MRTLDTVNEHEPVWLAEWRDRDGYLVERRLIDAIERMRLLRAGAVEEVGGAESLEIIPLNDRP